MNWYWYNQFLGPLLEAAVISVLVVAISAFACWLLEMLKWN